MREERQQPTTTSTKSLLLIVAGLLLLVAGAVGGHYLLPGLLAGDEVEHDHSAGYYCPMHPQVTSDEPGVCPICTMDLVPMDNPNAMERHLEDSAGDLGGEISITPRDRIVADVGTWTVGFRQITSDIIAPAVVEINEATEKSITAWFPGRLDRLYIEKTGDYIRKGAPLAEIYAPELITAQQEYLLALETRRGNLLPSFEGSGADASSTTQEDRLVEAAEERLALLGMTDRQISSLRSDRKIARRTTIFATASGIVTRKGVREGAYVNEGTTIAEVVDLSSVWVIASVPEAQADMLRLGMSMEVRLSSGEARSARIDYIYPMVDPESRTVQVRATFANPKLRLKPGMYLTATVILSARDALAVPVGALIRTGERDIVYVEVATNTFEAREVKVGVKGDGFHAVTGGDLKRGDRVVSEGGYLLDAERQLSTGSGNEHQH